MGLVPKLKQVTVLVPGTAVPLLAPGDIQENVVSFVLSVIVGSAYLGDSTVSVVLANGIPLDQVPLKFEYGGTAGYDLAKLYVDAIDPNTKVNLLYFVKV